MAVCLVPHGILDAFLCCNHKGLPIYLPAKRSIPVTFCTLWKRRHSLRYSSVSEVFFVGILGGARKIYVIYVIYVMDLPHIPDDT